MKGEKRRPKGKKDGRKKEEKQHQRPGRKVICLLHFLDSAFRNNNKEIELYVFLTFFVFCDEITI